MPKSTTPWTTGEPTTSAFALPGGLTGWLAGRIMLLTNKQRDLVDLLDTRDTDRVLEVGYGPGGLIRQLRSTPAATICGVDPSPQMCDLAVRRHRADIAAGRIDLRLGTAADTGFGDAEFDRVVSVNNVAIWPDLEAGLDELQRVTRPRGRLILGWHGGSHPNRISRSLALRSDSITRIENGLRERFVEVARRELSDLTVWIATR
ncbi:MAG: class I SAM-dependent methyltransferase [Stackebrandtia sp.]